MSAISTPASERRLHVIAQQLVPVLSDTTAASNTPPCYHQQQPLQRKQTAGHSSNSMFAGKVIVITGAAKGIGEAAALQFAGLGGQLLLTDLDKAAIEATAERCRQAGSPKVITVSGDITAPNAAADIAAALQKQFGRLDVLVNNAGGQTSGK